MVVFYLEYCVVRVAVVISSAEVPLCFNGRFLSSVVLFFCTELSHKFSFEYRLPNWRCTRRNELVINVCCIQWYVV